MCWLLHTFEYQDQLYEIAVRVKRQYLPAEIELIDFTHERYPGTEMPYNFASDVIIHEDGAKRASHIYMNHPLRWSSYTFYQASFAENDTMSMFQVVRNPAQWMPYVACLIASIGMLYQFGVRMFFRRGS